MSRQAAVRHVLLAGKAVSRKVLRASGLKLGWQLAGGWVFGRLRLFGNSLPKGFFKIGV